MIAPVRCRTKGELEARISQLVIHFEREFMGRGPLETRTYLVDDMVLVRLKGVLTVAEQKLAATGEGGRRQVKQMRQTLIHEGQSVLQQSVGELVGVPVASVHTDINPDLDERVIVFCLVNPSSGKR